jgi:hypothetical protein
MPPHVAGLSPAGLSSVAPRGIPFSCVLKPELPVPSGDVAPIPGVGLTCAKHTAQVLSQTSAAVAGILVSRPRIGLVTAVARLEARAAIAVYVARLDMAFLLASLRRLVLDTVDHPCDVLAGSCWPEPPPYVMALHFGVHILQQRDEVTLLYLLYNTVRHVRLNESHPENLTPSWQGHSVGRYEGDTLVIDTVGIKVSPLSTVDPFGTPHSKALHVVERYRLIDGEAAAEDQQKHGAIFRPTPPYGRGTIDPDTAKKGLQVEFTVEDPDVFTTPWSGRVTYRRLIGYWPEAVCAENPFFLGSDATMPTAYTPDF